MFNFLKPHIKKLEYATRVLRENRKVAKKELDSSMKQRNFLDLLSFTLDQIYALGFVDCIEILPNEKSKAYYRTFKHPEYLGWTLFIHNRVSRDWYNISFRGYFTNAFDINLKSEKDFSKSIKTLKECMEYINKNI